MPPEMRRGAGPTQLVFQPLGRRRGNRPRPTARSSLKIKTVFRKKSLSATGCKTRAGSLAEAQEPVVGGDGGKQRGVLRRYWSCPSMPAAGTGG